MEIGPLSNSFAACVCKGNAALQHSNAKERWVEACCWRVQKKKNDIKVLCEGLSNTMISTPET